MKKTDTPSWVENQANGWFETANQHVGYTNAEASFAVTAISAGQVTIQYKVSSEENSDKLTVKYNDTVIADGISGDGNWLSYAVSCNAGDTFTVSATYAKDGFVDLYSDTAFIKIDGEHHTWADLLQIVTHT